MRFLIACDKFKGSLSAAEVAAALESGIRREDAGAEVVRLPVADGGEGTLEAAIRAGFDRVPLVVSGPTGDLVETAYARRGRAAVVELADASGLARLPDGPAPLVASTVGAGQLLAAAVDAGCDEIVLGLGGSSSTDGGAGMLVGLGATISDHHGRLVPPGGAGLIRAAAVDVSLLRRRMRGVRLTLATDVDSPLLGPSGAARVFAPQKGASAADIEVLEGAMAHWAELVGSLVGHDARERAGAGAAGGAGFAALSLLGAASRPGVDVILELVDFASAVESVDVVITGEGSLDGQSLAGKAPAGVARWAGKSGVRVVAVCGRRALGPDSLRRLGFAETWALTDLEPDPARCMTEAADLLVDVGSEVARWAAASL